MTVPCLKRNLRQSLYALITFLVVLDTLFRVGMMKLANPYGQTIFVREFPVCDSSEDVVFFKSELSSAEEADFRSL